MAAIIEDLLKFSTRVKVSYIMETLKLTNFTYCYSVLDVTDKYT